MKSAGIFKKQSFRDYSNQHKRGWSKQLLLTLPYFIFTLLLMIIPIIMIFVKSFTPTSFPIKQNWVIIDTYIWWKIFQSFYIAVASTALCILISYPFAYFLSFGTTKTFRTTVVLIATSPIWTSFLVKLIGLKTFFDAMYGYQNATYGDIWTVIGLTYLYMPFMVLPLYSVMNDMPKNLIYASKDLGRSGFATFFLVVLPYTRLALLSGITLVFLPSLTSVAVPQFLNSSPSGSMIGDIIVHEGEIGLTSNLSLARASTLSLVLSLVILVGFAILHISARCWKKFKKTREAKNV